MSRNIFSVVLCVLLLALSVSAEAQQAKKIPRIGFLLGTSQLSQNPSPLFGSGGFHSLRHSFATRYLDAGGNVKDLQRLMGHSDLKITQRYLHADEEQMKKIVERMK
jgi:site-specific recombinase XerD